MPEEAARAWRRLPRTVGDSLTMVRVAAPFDWVATIALQAVSALCLLVQLLALRRVLQVLVAHSDHASRSHLLFALILLGLLSAVSALSGGLANERARMMVELVRRHAMEQILDVTTSVDLCQFEDAAFNDGLIRARQDALIRPLQVVTGLFAFIQGALTSIGLLVVLAVVAPLLLPILLVGLVPVMIGLRRNGRDMHVVDRELITTDRSRWYLEDVLATPAGAKETRSFRLAEFLGPRHRALADRRVDSYRALIRRRSRRVAAVSVFGAAATTGGLALLAVMVLNGSLAAANAATAGVIVLQLTSMLRAAGAGAGQMYENMLYLRDVEVFLARARQHTHPPATAPTRAVEPLRSIRISSLNFAYPGTDRLVLKDVSLEIAQGEVVALVGRNGSGKTTLIKLLSGLYAAPPGTMFWNGQDATGIDPEDWRRRFGVVFQDFMRYELAARVNVGVGHHETEDDLEAIRQAARLADADGFLSRLVGGYETILSRAYSGGNELSIGQWQRVALARAFFSPSPVLILDEPTSALDPRVENDLLGRVRDLAGDKTVVIATHRLSSIQFVDRVLVLREGVLVEEGRHEDLMQLDGDYADLFSVQADAYRWDSGAEPVESPVVPPGPSGWEGR